MGVAEKERKWARRVSELENLWGEKGGGGGRGGCEGGAVCVSAQHNTEEQLI